jgi:hypothetical protein
MFWFYGNVSYELGTCFTTFVMFLSQHSYLRNLLTLSGGMFGLEGGKQVAVVCRLVVQSMRLADVFWPG